MKHLITLQARTAGGSLSLSLSVSVSVSGSVSGSVFHCLCVSLSPTLSPASNVLSLKLILSCFLKLDLQFSFIDFTFSSSPVIDPCLSADVPEGVAPTLCVLTNAPADSLHHPPLGRRGRATVATKEGVSLLKNKCALSCLRTRHRVVRMCHPSTRHLATAFFWHTTVCIAWEACS